MSGDPKLQSTAAAAFPLLFKISEFREKQFTVIKIWQIQNGHICAALIWGLPQPIEQFRYPSRTSLSLTYKGLIGA